MAAVPLVPWVNDVLVGWPAAALESVTVGAGSPSLMPPVAEVGVPSVAPDGLLIVADSISGLAST